MESLEFQSSRQLRKRLSVASSDCGVYLIHNLSMLEEQRVIMCDGQIYKRTWQKASVDGWAGLVGGAVSDR